MHRAPGGNVWRAAVPLLGLVTSAALPVGGSAAGRAPFELTEENTTRYCQVLEWALRVELSNDQKAEAARILQSYVEHQDREQLEHVRSAVETQLELAEMTPAERRDACAKNLPGTLRKLDEEAANGQYEARWIRRIYYAAHPAVAPGPPPLTRDLADSWLELDAWLRSRVLDPKSGSSRPAGSRARRLGWVKAKWRTLSTDDRYRFMALPWELSELKRRWPTQTPRQRSELRLRVVYEDKFLLGPVEAGRR